MRIFLKIFLIILLNSIASIPTFAFEKLFYILRSNSSRIAPAQSAFASMTAHPHAIDLLVPQAFQIDANGLVWGFIDSEVLTFAKNNHIKLMPLITNVAFDKIKVHDFLNNPKSQTRALELLLQICKQYNLYGLQMDFEMVPLADRDLLTDFYRKTAAILHKNGYKISFAVAPVVSAGPMPSDFLKRIYENWEGAYDLKMLGQFGDFLTIMTYNQHAGKTTPGPTAGIPWDEAVIQYVLTQVPKEKISLGIPFYSEYWTTSPNLEDPLKKVEAYATGISYDKAMALVKKFNAQLIWDNKQKNYYTFYENNWLNEYIFLEEANSFKEKVSLAKKYNLIGISVFCLGIEDPKIWLELNNKI